MMKIGENRDSSGRNVTAVFKTDGIGRKGHRKRSGIKAAHKYAAHKR